MLASEETRRGKEPEAVEGREVQPERRDEAPEGREARGEKSLQEPAGREGECSGREERKSWAQAEGALAEGREEGES